MHSSLFHIKTRGGVCVHGNDLTAAAVCKELQLEMFGREGAGSTEVMFWCKIPSSGPPVIVCLWAVTWRAVRGGKRCEEKREEM